jgi:hypothetical protein
MSRFNQRNWNGLRTLLADEVKLHQRPLRVGRADVGWFCTLYAKIDRAWLARPGLRVGSRETAASPKERGGGKRPSDRISSLR